MLYKFLCAHKARNQFTLETVPITAETEITAIHKLGVDFQCLGLVARLPLGQIYPTLSKLKGGIYA